MLFIPPHLSLACSLQLLLGWFIIISEWMCRWDVFCAMSMGMRDDSLSFVKRENYSSSYFIHLDLVSRRRCRMFALFAVASSSSCLATVCFLYLFSIYTLRFWQVEELSLVECVSSSEGGNIFFGEFSCSAHCTYFHGIRNNKAKKEKKMGTKSNLAPHVEHTRQSTGEQQRKKPTTKVICCMVEGGNSSLFFCFFFGRERGQCSM